MLRQNYLVYASGFIHGEKKIVLRLCSKEVQDVIILNAWY